MARNVLKPLVPGVALSCMRTVVPKSLPLTVTDKGGGGVVVAAWAGGARFTSVADRSRIVAATMSSMRPMRRRRPRLVPVPGTLQKWLMNPSPPSTPSRADFATSRRPKSVKARFCRGPSSLSARTTPLRATSAIPTVAVLANRVAIRRVSGLGTPRNPSSNATSPPSHVPEAAT